MLSALSGSPEKKSVSPRYQMSVLLDPCILTGKLSSHSRGIEASPQQLLVRYRPEQARRVHRGIALVANISIVKVDDVADVRTFAA